MEIFYLIKLGEINLKIGNREEFELKLVRQLEGKLAGKIKRLERYPGRYFLTVDECDAPLAELAMETTPGINGYARAIKCAKDMAAILDAAESIAVKLAATGITSFKAETRRSDKRFPLGSYEVSAAIGERVLGKLPALRVDVKNPDLTINVEIRERVYVFGESSPCMRGLPVGSGGRGLLLLSGGIDSPVAGYLMARRGLDLTALYFHAHPYTSEEARQKVISLARIVARYTGGLRLFIVGFTDVQKKIQIEAPSNATTLMLRAAMMEAAHRIAGRVRANSIVTGESLGQVASQTAENIRFTQSTTSLPVLRPLIGMDKEETIGIARRIGSYEISILPYEDCCVLFSPEHPVLKAEYAASITCYEGLGLKELIIQAVRSAQRVDLSWNEAMQPLALP